MLGVLIRSKGAPVSRPPRCTRNRQPPSFIFWFNAPRRWWRRQPRRRRRLTLKEFCVAGNFRGHCWNYTRRKKKKVFPKWFLMRKGLPSPPRSSGNAPRVATPPLHCVSVALQVASSGKKLVNLFNKNKLGLARLQIEHSIFLWQHFLNSNKMVTPTETLIRVAAPKQPLLSVAIRVANSTWQLGNVAKCCFLGRIFGSLTKWWPRREL